MGAEQRAAHELIAQLMGRPLVDDPFPLYAQLRHLAPVHREADGFWYLTRHRDCEALFRSARFGHHGYHGHHGHEAARSDAARAQLVGRMFSFVDPPSHTAKRAVFAAPFTVAASESYKPVIEAKVARLLDDAGRGGRLDVDAIASGLPVQVTCELLGIPAADHERCVAWVEAMTSVNQPVPVSELEAHANAAAVATIEYFGELLAQRRLDPQPDMLTHVAQHPTAMPDDERIANIVMLMAAGFETTRYTIAGGIIALIEHPEQLAAARVQIERRGLLTDATIEELLRHQGPIHAALPRRSLGDERFGDVVIPKGEPVVAMVAAANRDPHAYPEPDRLDLERVGPRPLAFGHGPHYCLGAFLAKHEINIAVSRLLQRFDSLGPVIASSVKGSFNVRGATGVMVGC